MAKVTKTATKKVVKTEEPKVACTNCNDSGYTCSVCGTER